MPTYSSHAVRLVCALVVAELAWVVPAEGQAVRDEGFPTKGVFPEEYPDVPGVEEACGPFEVPGAFGEGCAEDGGPDAFGPVAGAGGFPNASPDPALRTAPRLECPAAVFVEEMETGSIDCHAWDEAGEEHLDYYWEPVEGAPRGYLDAPRLTGEDRPNPSIVAPSSPFYDTLESFLSEDATLRYRYRVTATSRVTGLSSRAEVEVFVLLRRPSVYCPLEYEVSAGSEVALSCEGADPLSFRMDYEAGSSVSWEWEGLWGSSASLLSASDTPSPLFRAPPGGAGETHHYIASMTTTSSGVPRTARRRVSVRVVEGEATDAAAISSLAARASAPTIECKDIEAYPTAPGFRLKCTVTNEPLGVKYSWTERGGTPKNILYDKRRLDPTFSMSDYTFQTQMQGNVEHEYRASMLDGLGVEVAYDDVTVTVLDHPNLITCATLEYEVTAKDPDFRFDCDANDANDPNLYAPGWLVTPAGWAWGRSVYNITTLTRHQTFSAHDKGGKHYFHVPDSLPAGMEIEYFQYAVCFYVTRDDPDIGTYILEECEYITVKVKKRFEVAVTCRDPYPAVFEGSPNIALLCTAMGAPSGSSYSYAWTARGSTPDTSRLSATNIDSPTFDVPDTVDEDEAYDYLLTVSADNAVDGFVEATVTVLNRFVMLSCASPAPVYEGSPDIALSCTAKGAPLNSSYSYAWTARGSTPDTDLLSATNVLSPTFDVPEDVPQTTKYEYRVTASAPNVEDAAAVTVTVLDKGALALTCADPAPVYEGSADITLDCEASGAPPGSDYAWTARGSTPDTGLLSETDVASPTFDVPEDVDQDETYEYALTVSADNAKDGRAEVTVTVLDKPVLDVACERPPPTYEGSADFALSCEATGVSDGISYAWTTRGSTADTGLLSETGISSPTFDVPEDVPQTTKYEYRVTVSAENAEDGMAEVTVTVVNAGELFLACASPAPVYEGSEDIALSCKASGAPDGSDYAWAWEARGATANTDLLSETNSPSPTFYAPDEVAAEETYEYRVTVSAENAEDGTADVTVTVLNRPNIMIACAGNPYSAYEGAADITLDCLSSGAPDGSDYGYAWEARGATANTNLLSAANVLSPTFDVPDEADADETYEYRLTASAQNAEDGTADVTVTVLNTGALALACDDPDPVYEGSEDITLDCSATGAPDGSGYAWAWAALGATPAGMLSAADGPTPTFYVPEEVDADETYEYRLTVSAANAEDAMAEVTVTILNRDDPSLPPPTLAALALTCANPAPVYEGSEDITLDCSATGAPDGSGYAWAWAALGATPAGMLSAADGPTPTFYVPEEVDADETYEYRLTVSAANAEDAMAEVTVTILNRDDPSLPPPTLAALALTCANPAPVYEGSEDIALNCSASGAPDGSVYAYAWEARGATANTDLLSAADVSSPTFYAPDEVNADETYEYGVTVSAENAEDAAAEVTVTILNRDDPSLPPPTLAALALTCANPDPVYEGSEDIALHCSASGAPDGSVYAYAWEARGATANTNLLSETNIPSPTFYVPGEVDETTRYEYEVTVSAANAEDAAAEVTVTILNRDDPPPPPALAALALTCANPAPVYEGSGDVALSCEASGAPDGSVYEYAWEALGATPAGMLSATDISSPTFDAPDEVDETTRYEYEVTVSAANAEPAAANVTVTVLDRPEAPAPPPAVAFSGDPTSLGVAASVSSLRFGAQPSGAQASLDPLTDRVSTSVSGPYHAGRMTLAPDGSLAFDANGELALSIELATPVTLRRVADETAGETAEEAGAATLALIPRWSIAASCEQLASEAIGGLRTQTTLAESDCRLLLFGGALDLAGAAPGRYAGKIDVILRTGAGEETHSVEAEATVVAPPRVITIGPSGVRFDASREIPAALTEEQNLSVYPDMAFMTRDEPSGAFELSNPSLAPLEVSVSARFGYAEATEDGRETVIEDKDASGFGDLSEIVNIYPRALTLMPGERGVVRYGVREESLSSLSEAGYAAFFEVTSSPRWYARADRLPEEETGGETARVTLRVPGAYVPGEIAPRLNATLLSLSVGRSPTATFLVETDGVPFAGEAVAYDEEGRELGRSETLTYARSRVRMLLDRLPEGETVLLRFTPRGAGDAPEPVAVPWHAPRREGRDIGAAQDSGVSPPNAVFAEKH